MAGESNKGRYEGEAHQLAYIKKETAAKLGQQRGQRREKRVRWGTEEEVEGSCKGRHEGQEYQ